MGMPLEAFTEEAYAGLAEGSDQIIIGGPEPRETYLEIVQKRRGMMEGLAAMMRRMTALGGGVERGRGDQEGK